MNRLQQILSAILVVQIALAAVVYWPRPSQASGEPLFGDLAAKEITSILIESSEDGTQIKIAKSGENWLLPEKGNYAVDGEKITAILEKFLEIKTNRLVAQNTESHKRLQVNSEAFVRRVTLETPENTFVLYVGSAPQTQSTHIRLDGQNEVYLTGALTSWDLNAAASNWIDTNYLSVAAADIKSIELKNASGNYHFNQAASGEWKFEELKSSDTFNPDKLTALLSRLANLRMTEPLGKEKKPEYGLDKTLALITLKTNNGPITLSIGAQDSSGSDYYAHASTSEYYVKIGNFNVQDFVNYTYQDFIIQKATETPAAQSSN